MTAVTDRLRLSARRTPESDAPKVHDDEWRSMRAHAPGALTIAAVAVLVVVASLSLVPEGDELVAARDSVQSPRGDLEAALTRGQRDVDTVSALARERVRTGDPLGAISLLQDFVQRDPKNGAGWRALVETYDALGRKAEAAAALRQWQVVDPTIERQRQLIARLHAIGDEPGATQALADLVGRARGATSDDYLQLADRQLAAKQPAEAERTLDALVARSPDQVSAAIVARRMRAALSAQNVATAAGDKGGAQALALARAWLQAHPQAIDADAPALAAPLTQVGMHAQAAALLEPFVKHGAPGIVTAWAQSMRAAAQGEAALARLASMTGSAQAQEVLRQRALLALDAGKPQAAFEAVRTLGLERAPGPLLVSVAAALIDDHVDARSAAMSSKRGADAVKREGGLIMADRLPLLRELWRSGSRDALVAADVVLAARTAWAVGDHAAATKLADQALAACEGKATCVLHLALIQHQLGRGPEAAAALQTMQAGEIEERLLTDYARLAISINQPREALARIDRQRRTSATPAFNEAWALAATAAGSAGDVERWLTSARTGDLRSPLLHELFLLAANQRAHALTVAVGQRLAAVTTGASLKPAERALLAQALGEVGRHTEALAQWKLVRAVTNAYDDAYAAAVGAAATQSKDPALQRAWVDTLAARLASLPPGAGRDETVRQLLGVGAHAQVLPTLEKMAGENPSLWLSSYEASAKQANQSQRLATVWRKAATDERLPAAARMDVAMKLLDVRDRDVAEATLRLLAIDALPTDPPVLRLLDHWGARLAPDELDWVEARAHSVGTRAPMGPAAAASARAAWMRVLNERGGAARSVAVYRRDAQRPTQGPVFEAYVDALTRLGDTNALATALRESAQPVR